MQNSLRILKGRLLCPACVMWAGLAIGCAGPHRTTPMAERPDLAPATQPAFAVPVSLEAGQVQPLHRELMAIDLPTALRIACAENLDIRRARQQVEVSRGQWQRTAGAVFPIITPNAGYEQVEGMVRAVQGDLVGATFNTFQPVIAAQWIVNPGQVIYDLIAARKRLYASEHQEQAVVIESLRLSAEQFYDLVLAQTRVATARQAAAEAEELLRISRLRSRTGTGVPADELRAQARLAERQQDLVSAINDFYTASVALAVTLHLDSSVTLAPSIEELPQVTLVRPDLPLDELLELAIVYRPDLHAVRKLVEAAAAARGGTWWGSFGPQFSLAYQYGGITGHANNVIPGQGIPGNLIINPASQNGAFSANPLANGLIREGIARGSAGLAGRRDQTGAFHSQQRFNAGAGWRFTLAAFGDLRAARAAEEQALIEAERQVDQIRAQVVLARESSRTNAELAGLAQQQVDYAQEALRLTQANLQAGSMTTLDVLQAQDAVNQARLRHAEAVVRYNQAQLRLTAALGLLNADML
ncbi:MAG: hypothetical protein AMXMBFR13_02360 [Phycisphaerae bacterium]